MRVSREGGEDPGVGRTEKAVTGFRSRAGRTFRAKLRLEQTDEGKWRVEFDEEWAKEPPAGESEEERAEKRDGQGDGRRGRPPPEAAESPTAGRGRGAGRSGSAGRLTAALRGPGPIRAVFHRCPSFAGAPFRRGGAFFLAISQGKTPHLRNVEGFGVTYSW